MSSPHKLAFYVAYLQDNTQLPNQVDLALKMILRQPHLRPLHWDEWGIFGPGTDWDMDRWWAAVVRQKREEVKRDLFDKFGPVCECCEQVQATDLHEVFVTRGDDTSWKQILNFTVDNCALVCQECHESRVYSDEFKQKMEKRRRWRC